MEIAKNTTATRKNFISIALSHFIEKMKKNINIMKIIEALKRIIDFSILFVLSETGSELIFVLFRELFFGQKSDFDPLLSSNDLCHFKQHLVELGSRKSLLRI